MSQMAVESALHAPLFRWCALYNHTASSLPSRYQHMTVARSGVRIALDKRGSRNRHRTGSSARICAEVHHDFRLRAGDDLIRYTDRLGGVSVGAESGWRVTVDPM